MGVKYQKRYVKFSYLKSFEIKLLFDLWKLELECNKKKVYGKNDRSFEQRWGVSVTYN